MYNPPGADDFEWIEICNLNGTAQDLSNYTIDVNNVTRFTFPVNSTIPANSCITVLLGHETTSPPPECPFTPDYSNPIGNTNYLTNTSATIEIIASNGISIVDFVSYDDNDSGATDGNGSSFHVIDATQDNSDTDTNWQAVSDGGSPGVNNLVSPCSKPELQLENSSGTDQACGAFTIDFGSQATGFDTELTFDINNEGTLDLTISSFTFSGTNPGDFSIVSPGTPFTITSGNTQTVTVRFTPSAIGIRLATLTINNNDADEGSCTIALQGTGTTPTPEINVEGDIGSYPDISNGDITPSGTDNTLFAAQFIGSSQAKSFRIQNLGTSDLTGINITIGGTNPGDFSITSAPSGTVNPSSLTTFEITFAPIATGVRIADISIANNDSDENPYTFRVQGTGNCAASSITITPTSGPESTIVSVTGTNLSTATASFNGVSATVNNISATQMEVTVPVGATTGNLEITDDNGCPGSASFMVIDNQISSCEGGSSLGELFISEITDATYGSLTYIEIYNATGSDINLSSYSIRIYANGSTSAYTEQVLSGTINNGDTFVLTTGTFGVLGNSLCSTSGGDGTYGDLISNNLAGINIGTGDDDYVGLYNGTTLIDEFGVFGNDDWTSSTILTGDRGFDFRRLNTASPLPTTTFNTNQWNIIDWAGSGSSSCVNTNDYSDIGIYDFSTGTPPSVTSGPNINSSCNSATISVTGSEGYSGGNSLTYQWYYSAPGDLGWTAITNGGFYDDATTETLDILDTSSLEGYQYYCQIREDDATCYVASDAVQLTLPTTTWDGSSWDNGTPDIDTIAIINSDYTTGQTNQPSFSACNLIVNSGSTLDITNSNFTNIQNNVTIYGDIIVRPYGALVQIANSGTFTLDPNGTAKVEKFTAEMNQWYEYTYWSSPIEDETIEDALSEASTNRRFWFNAQNYRDSKKENGNSNNYTDGQDDVDDDVSDGTGVDWQSATGVMQPGVGYASTHSSIGFNSIPCSGGPGCQFKYTFEGAFNTGTKTVPIYRNDDELMDNNWNFLGNPYPSAIDADLFLAANTIDTAVQEFSPNGVTDGAIFFWSQDTPPSNSNNGNQQENFSQDDYAIINTMTQTAGGDGVEPTRHIPSGQGFFISYANVPEDANNVQISASPKIIQGSVTFTNSMRVTGNNNLFFRNSNIVDSTKEVLKINLTSDNGVFNQLAIGYIDRATNGYDGMAYDTPRNLSSALNSSIYTIIEGSDKKFAIQGRNITSLSSDEIIPLGFDTSINVATLYTLSIASLEGDFFNANDIFLVDHLLNTTQSLKSSGYTFTSEVGEFNNRFEIVFSMETLSNQDFEIDSNSLSIIELLNGNVKFNLNSNIEMESIEILDMLGRMIYKFNTQGYSQIFDLSRLSQATYIAKVKLTNGYTITKKAIKRN